MNEINDKSLFFFPLHLQLYKNKLVPFSMLETLYKIICYKQPLNDKQNGRKKKTLDTISLMSTTSVKANVSLMYFTNNNTSLLYSQIKENDK